MLSDPVRSGLMNDVKHRLSRSSRRLEIGSVALGGSEPVLLQSMCATRTTDISATLRQIRQLKSAGAGLVRLAIDTKKDVEALAEIRKETNANLVVDLQENYRLAAEVAPFVQKFRYNPGHLHRNVSARHERNMAVSDKVAFLAEVAGAHNCAMRIGVNFGSLDPALKDEGSDASAVGLRSALEHCEMLDRLGFKRYVVSLKSSHPEAVIALNRKFASIRPDVALHLGVTEAGLLPEGAIKSRLAFEPLIAAGIGDTVRVSLTLPDEEKHREIEVARQILEDIYAGRFLSDSELIHQGVNVISCPSCSRVENQAFVKLAQKVKHATAFAAEHRLTIAVMGCRVNGPGETDMADLGLWCAANFVNLKRGKELIGAFSYEDVVRRLIQEVEEIIRERQNCGARSACFEGSNS